MKNLVVILMFLTTIFAGSVEWRMDRFNESGKVSTVDGKYIITKKDPLAGTLHVDYSDKDLLLKTRLKAELEKMNRSTKENYIKTIPNGGYLTLFIPRPVVEQSETRWFIYEVFDEEGASLLKSRGSAVLTKKDSATENSSTWIAVQTIPLPNKIASQMVVEVTGESCGETQVFTIKRK